MKKQLSLLFLTLGLVLFFSCTDDDLQVENVQSGKMSSFLVSPDSAIAISNQAIRAISENKETRSSLGNRQVGSVKMVNLASNVETRSQSRNALNHAWVIDGYCTNVVDAEDSSTLYNTVLFHCIWGWNGDNNGYFYLNNGKLGGPASLFAGGDNGNTATNNYTELQYIANFRINRDKQSVDL